MEYVVGYPFRDFAAMNAGYGFTPGEFSTLQKFVKVHEKKKQQLEIEHKELDSSFCYFTAWRQWARDSLDATPGKRKRLELEPKEGDF